jgi:hypothetical protein
MEIVIICNVNSRLFVNTIELTVILAIAVMMKIVTVVLTVILKIKQPI